MKWNMNLDEQTFAWWENMALVLAAEFVKRGDRIEQLEQQLAKAETRHQRIRKHPTRLGRRIVASCGIIIDE